MLLISVYRWIGPVELGRTDPEYGDYLSRSTTSLREYFPQSFVEYYNDLSKRFGQPSK